VADKKVGNLTLGVQAQVKGFEGAIGGIAKLGLAISGVQKVAQIATRAITMFTDAANVQELAVVRLSSAMETSGIYTEKNLENLQNYASELQKVTTVGDEMTLGVMQIGLQMGVSGDKIKEATKGAIGLSKAFGIDLKGTMKYVALAMQGEYTMLQRYVPALRAAQNETEKLAIFQKAMADGFKVAEAETQTAAGQMMQFKNIVGDVKEEVGYLINDALFPLIKSMKEFLEMNMDKIKFNLAVVRDTLIASWETSKTIADWIRIAFDVLALSIMSSITLVSEGIKIFADSMIITVRGLAWVIDKVFKTDLVTGIDNFRKGVDNALSKPLQISKMLLGDIKKTFDSIYETTTPVKNDMEDIADAADKISKSLGGEKKGVAGPEATWISKLRGLEYDKPDMAIKTLVHDTEDWNDKLQLVANSFDVIFDKTKSMQSKMEDILKLIIQFGIGLAAQSNPALAPFAPIIGGIIGGAFSGGGGGTVININNPLLSDQTSYENIANNIRNGLLKSSMNNGGVISV
jgi:hypothetical protein